MCRFFLRFFACSLGVFLFWDSPAAGQQTATPATTEGDFVAKNFQFRSGESRSEEHTSELQSRVDLVCRLLLEKKNFVALTHTKTSWPHGFKRPQRRLNTKPRKPALPY